MGLIRRPLLVLFACALSTIAFAQAAHDRTQFGHEITIGPNEEASDVTCFECSVRVRGQVSGDVTTFGGTIVVEDNGEINGDTTSFGGDVRLEGAAKINAVTIFGGKLRRNSAATVAGDVTTFAGGPALWLFIIFGLPFVVLGALIALIIWLVRRFSHPAARIAAGA